MLASHGLHWERLVRVFGGRAQILVRKINLGSGIKQRRGKIYNFAATQMDWAANSPGKLGQSSFGAADGNNKNIVNTIKT